MDQSAYVAGFFGVLIGITLTELIKGIAETIRNMKRIKYYIPHGILVFAIFILIVQSFFDFQWLSRGISIWTPLLIIRFTIPWIIICLCSYLVFPSFDGQHVIHFKDHFDKFSFGAFKFGVVLIPLIIIVNIVSLGHDFFHFENLVMTFFMGLIILAMVLKRDWLTIISLCSGTCYLFYDVLSH
jgi:hypothetical protein